MSDLKDKDGSERPSSVEATSLAPPTHPLVSSSTSEETSAMQLPASAEGKGLAESGSYGQPTAPLQPSPSKSNLPVEREAEDKTPQSPSVLEPSLSPLPSSPLHDVVPTINTPVDEKEPIVSVQPLSLSPALSAQDLGPSAKQAYDDKDSSHGTLSVRSASSLRTPSPLRYNVTPYSVTPGRPATLMSPPDGRPREDVPYDFLTTSPEPADYPALSGQGRRTTMYFDASRTSLDSVKSHEPRQVEKAIEKKQDTGFWQSIKGCFGC